MTLIVIFLQLMNTGYMRRRWQCMFQKALLWLTLIPEKPHCQGEGGVQFTLNKTLNIEPLI